MPEPDFEAALRSSAIELFPTTVETLQANITKLCNQACQHCHVDASPKRTEQMPRSVIDQCLRVLAHHSTLQNLDLTGGAPELHPHFDGFVARARRLGKHVMVRHNLTVTLDGNPQTKETKTYLPAFFAENKVEVISSLPCYQPYRTDQQRGPGVFQKSIESLKRLNAVGYGQPGSELTLSLVYNPVGTSLPPPQAELEAEYRRHLGNEFGIVFTRLFTLTNMPIHRFRRSLERTGTYDGYLETLVQRFNPRAASEVMCRQLISVAYDGTLFDCDFNQMLELPLNSPAPRTIFDFDEARLRARQIHFGSHCFGCTAGAGSSCRGQSTFSTKR